MPVSRTDIHFIGANDVSDGRHADALSGICRNRHDDDPDGACNDGLCCDGCGRGFPSAGGGVGSDVPGNLPIPGKDAPGRVSCNNSYRADGSQTRKSPVRSGDRKLKIQIRLHPDPPEVRNGPRHCC